MGNGHCGWTAKPEVGDHRFASRVSCVRPATHEVSPVTHRRATPNRRAAPPSPTIARRSPPPGARRIAPRHDVAQHVSGAYLMVGSSKLSTVFPQQERPLPRPTVPNDAAAIADGFRSPPIVEVSLAVVFQPIGLDVMKASDLWRSKYAGDFPNVEEQAPIRLPQERFGATATPQPAFSVEMMNAPSLPRLWFLNEDGTELVQIQPDWFARNWREGGAYPLYSVIRDAFERDYIKFTEFVDEQGLGPVKPLQAEISYINHIDDPDLSAVMRSVTPNPDLPEPEALSFNAQYVLGEDGDPVGRLHLQATKALHRSKGKPITVLTVTARGRPLRDGTAGVLAFLDLGATRALELFVRSTRPEMHEKWSQG